ncbi:MAG: biopolymer transporter ExbD [Leptospiraceae bacterium]|nr:biopolymer transporter ExbD [Leptospiraceae bacterium]
MTSFMDIIFILLIFVMLSVSFTKNFQSMELDIPNAKNVSGNTNGDIIVNINSLGEFFLDKDKIEWSLVEKKILSGEWKNKSILLNIEKKTHFEVFIKFADALKSGEIKKMNLGVKE